MKISFKSHTWKWKHVCVKNITYSFHEIWWSLSFFCTREKKKSFLWKFSQFHYIMSMKKKIPLWKYLKMRPWKIWNAREKVLKNARESHITFLKKIKKRQKTAFTGTFYFHGKKKVSKVGKRPDNLFLEVGKNIEKRNNNLYNLKFQILTNPRKNVKSMKT